MAPGLAGHRRAGEVVVEVQIDRARNVMVAEPAGTGLGVGQIEPAVEYPHLVGGKLGQIGCADQSRVHPLLPGRAHSSRGRCRSLMSVDKLGA